MYNRTIDFAVVFFLIQNVISIHPPGDAMQMRGRLCGPLAQRQTTVNKSLVVTVYEIGTCSGLYSTANRSVWAVPKHRPSRLSTLI